MSYIFIFYVIFFFNDTATTEIYTLSLHDALPIYFPELTACCIYVASCTVFWPKQVLAWLKCPVTAGHLQGRETEDRKSTRLNSSHQIISYAVFCLKKKKKLLHDAQAETHNRIANV